MVKNMKNSRAGSTVQENPAWEDLRHALARKARIKAELARLTKSARTAPKREALLYGRLVEIAALSRTIPARRIRPLVRAERTRVLSAPPSFAPPKTDAGDRHPIYNCATNCTDCVTSCTECVSSCSSECTTQCTSDCIACSSDPTVGCPHKTFGEQNTSGRRENSRPRRARATIDWD